MTPPVRYQLREIVWQTVGVHIFTRNVQINWSSHFSSTAFSSPSLTCLPSLLFLSLTGEQRFHKERGVYPGEDGSDVQGRGPPEIAIRPREQTRQGHLRVRRTTHVKALWVENKVERTQPCPPPKSYFLIADNDSFLLRPSFIGGVKSVSRGQRGAY